MNRNRWAAIAATVVVIVVLILGFRFLGSPASQRLARADAQDVRALAQIAQQVNLAWVPTPHALPENLDKIPGIKKNSLTGKPFVYHPKHDSAYELCAIFATDNRQRPDTNTGDFWLHSKGDYCFQLHASDPVPSAPYMPY